MVAKKRASLRAASGWRDGAIFQSHACAVDLAGSLFVSVDPAPGQPLVPSRWFGATRLVGSFTRESRNGPLESWSAFIVSAPTPELYAGFRR